MREWQQPAAMTDASQLAQSLQEATQAAAPAARRGRMSEEEAHAWVAAALQEPHRTTTVDDLRDLLSWHGMPVETFELDAERRTQEDAAKESEERRQQQLDAGLKLIDACEQGDLPEVVRLVNEVGALVDQTNEHGVTALMMARKRGYEEIIEFLREHGTDPPTDDKAEEAVQEAAADAVVADEEEAEVEVEE